MPPGALCRARFSERNLLAVLLLTLLFTAARAANPEPLPGTSPLTIEGDLASQMVDGLHRFLATQTDKTARQREDRWKQQFAHPETRQAFLASERAWLADHLGLRESRPKKVEMELVATTDRPAVLDRSDRLEITAVRWNAFADVHGEGLLLTPRGREPIADEIVIPDADQTPELLAGLTDPTDKRPNPKLARRLAESGCRVIVPDLLDRQPRPRIPPGRTTGPDLSNREVIYRTAYELGRHPIGYGLTKIQAAADWLQRDPAAGARKLGLFGYGEGGMLALYAAALDTRFDVTVVSGYFGCPEPLSAQPIERNVFGLSEHVGDAELALMASPRRLIIEDAHGPAVEVKSKWTSPARLSGELNGQREYERALSIADPTGKTGITVGLIVAKGGDIPYANVETLRTFLESLDDKARPLPETEPNPKVADLAAVNNARESRQSRQFHELDRHTQDVLARSADVRREFMKKLDTSSVEKYEQSAKPYREQFYRDVLGRFDEPLLPMNARTRKVYDTDKYAGYEVVLDVFPDVFAYGVLLLPKDMKEGERRPVVVCQHGLEGRPRDTIEGDSHFYHAFAARLAEQGFITFAPQNPYIFGDRFRTLVREANPLGKSLWSIIIPQHQQILNFLKSQPNVDPQRIAFYGLSYGGKTAMRVPAVLTDYCLSICSGDFNEWVVKCSSSRLAMSYLFTNEYDMFEFDLGSTFNYAEMAALIAPRPFMVERGHFDGVSSDEWVAFEFAKVRRLYQGNLKLPEGRCQIEFFDGPHEIHGVGTFEFLHKHLNWEKPR
jgi:dienelactone hydrolase